MQAKAGILAAIGGISLYFLDSSHPGACYFGISGICFLALFPWTKFKIMPINNALMDESALKKNDEWINDMIDNWGRVHFVRTVLGGIAFALNIRAILMWTLRENNWNKYLRNNWWIKTILSIKVQWKYVHISKRKYWYNKR